MASKRRRKPRRTVEYKLDTRFKYQLGSIVVGSGLREQLGLAGDIVSDADQLIPVRMLRGACCLLVGALSGDLREQYLEAWSIADESSIDDLEARRPFRRLKGESVKAERRLRIQLGGIIVQTGLASAMRLAGNLRVDPEQRSRAAQLRGAFARLTTRLAEGNTVELANALMARGEAFEQWLSEGGRKENDPYMLRECDANLLRDAMSPSTNFDSMG